jgi:hypothetical protein
VDILARVTQEQRRPITTHVLPGVNHGLRNPVTGAQPDFWRPIADWLASLGMIGLERQRPPARP